MCLRAHTHVRLCVWCVCGVSGVCGVCVRSSRGREHLLLGIRYASQDIKTHRTADREEADVTNLRLFIDIAFNTIQLGLVLNLSDVDEVVHIHPHIVVVVRVLIEACFASVCLHHLCVENIAFDATNKALVADIFVGLLALLPPPSASVFVLLYQ